jgi:homeobox protein cut-like
VHVGIDLTHNIPKLDSTASEIISHQRDALVQRKDLAQKTKDFRKLDDASKLGEYKSLLKGKCFNEFTAENEEIWLSL